MSMNCACKLFVFSISYTVLNNNSPPCILYLSIMLLNSCTFSPILSLPQYLPNDLHICDSDPVCLVCFLFYFKFLFIFYFLEKGRKRERGEKHQCASRVPPNGDLAHNPGMCPRLGIEPVMLWFAGQHSTTEPHQPGQFGFLDSVAHSCEFVAILMFIVLIFLFSLNRSL